LRTFDIGRAERDRSSAEEIADHGRGGTGGPAGDSDPLLGQEVVGRSVLGGGRPGLRRRRPRRRLPSGCPPCGMVPGTVGTEGTAGPLGQGQGQGHGRTKGRPVK
jgi:hypothetical protein